MWIYVDNVMLSHDPGAGAGGTVPPCVSPRPWGWLRVTQVQHCCSSLSEHLDAESEESRCYCAVFVGFLPAWGSSVLQKSSAACSRQLEVPWTQRWLPGAGKYKIGWRAGDYSCWLQWALNFTLDTTSDVQWLFMPCHINSPVNLCKFGTLCSCFPESQNNFYILNCFVWLQRNNEKNATMYQSLQGESPVPSALHSSSDFDLSEKSPLGSPEHRHDLEGQHSTLPLLPSKFPPGNVFSPQKICWILGKADK